MQKPPPSEVSYGGQGWGPLKQTIMISFIHLPPISGPQTPESHLSFFGSPGLTGGDWGSSSFGGFIAELQEGKGRGKGKGKERKAQAPVGRKVFTS